MIVYNNIQKYGNTTAGSIPIALTETWENSKINDGDIVVLAAFEWIYWKHNYKMVT